MCQIVPTSTLRKEVKEFFVEREPERCIGDNYAVQFEPWRSPSRELWTDEVLEQIVAASIRRRKQSD